MFLHLNAPYKHALCMYALVSYTEKKMVLEFHKYLQRNGK